MLGRGMSLACALALIVVSILGPLGGRSSVEARNASQTLRIALVEQPSTLDPLHAADYFANYLDEAIFSGLTVLDDRGRVAPDLAERVPTRENGDISADGKTIVYHLREGVRWQDGAPLTSRDVAFTFAKMREPPTNFVQATVYSIVARVDTPDDRTAIVRLRSAWADATSQLFVGGQNGSIVPEHLLKDVRDLGRSAFESVPIGSGPYRVERWERGSRIVLGANENYFRGSPAIGRIVISFVPDHTTAAIGIRTGELDFAPQISQVAAIGLRDVPGLQTRSATTYTDIELGFNTKRAPFDDARVRRALAGAIDRERLVATVFRGVATVALGLAPPQSSMYVTPRNVHSGGDVAQAARLLDAAGWRPGAGGVRRKNGVPLAFDLLTRTGYDALTSIAVQMQATWRELGANVTLKPESPTLIGAPTTGLFARGDFDAYVLVNAYSTSADRSDTLTTSGFPPAGNNYTHYASPEVDRDMLLARRTLAPTLRRAIYARIAQRVLTDAALTPLLWLQEVYPYTSRLDGVRPEPVNSDLWNVYAWRLKPPGTR